MNSLIDVAYFRYQVLQVSLRASAGRECRYWKLDTAEVTNMLDRMEEAIKLVVLKDLQMLSPLTDDQRQELVSAPYIFGVKGGSRSKATHSPPLD
jgi:hypothetical protein